MESGDPRGQSFAELVWLQKNLKKELTVQTRFIKQIPLLAQAEEELLPLLELFDCPIAVFKRSGVLHRANRVLLEHTDLQAEDIVKGNINFTGRITNENSTMLEAAEGVFYGKTALLSRLTYPLELFCRHPDYSVEKAYHRALFFPLQNSNGRVTFGVVMLMK